MPKITEEPLSTIQLRLFTEDLDYLRSIYGQTMGYNYAIRTLVRNFVKKAKEAANSLEECSENIS